MVQKNPEYSPAGVFHVVLVSVLILLGMWLRIDWMNRSSLWCDEAESGINALTILDRGFPLNEYLGIPVYENTLTEPWKDHPEYEFRDSSYSPQGFAVYHGWLPLYAIAASEALFGLHPDHPSDPPKVLHGPEEIPLRTLAPRVPSLVFSAFFLLLVFFLGRDLGGSTAGFAALTLVAFNARTVDFGYQARYYSLTLLMSVFAAWCLLRVANKGRWRDYLMLGLAEALLFHTHQFSALVFAVVAVVALPVMIHQRNWFWKSLAGGILSACLVLPWIWFSGFLVAASGVPKACKLFDSWTDWMTYTFQRPDQLVMLAVMIFLLVAGKRKLSWLPGRIGTAIGEHGQIYFALLAWLVAGYAAFHLIVPAASFFYERLTLVLWTPYVLLISLFTADLLRGVPVRTAGVAGILAMTGLLFARGRLAFMDNPSVGGSRMAVASVISALENVSFQAGTRFYATPNEHLTYTYYSGLPVQSVAPVRKSFFATHPGPVVFVESQMENMFPPEEDVVTATAAAGMPADPDGIRALGELVWRTLAVRELKARGIRGAEPPDLPDYLRPLVEKTYFDLLVSRKKFLNDMKSMPIFRHVPAGRAGDFWLGFFYCFVHPEDRVGSRLNIFPRLETAEVLLLPRANTVIYFTSLPHPSTNSAGGNGN